MTQYCSYRDPCGSVVFDLESVWRKVNLDSDSELQNFLSLDLVKEWQINRILIEAIAGSADEFGQFSEEDLQSSDGYKFYKHPRIDFPSFPYEWPPEMLHAAAKQTITLAQDLLPLGWGLKDATPYNILFQGTKPIFIDILSFERRGAQDPIWLPYNQFISTFIVPLLLNKLRNVYLNHIFQINKNGVDISEASQYFGLGGKLNPLVFSLLTVPNFLAKRAEKKTDLYKKLPRVPEAQAKFVLASTFRRLGRQLSKVAPDPRRQSKWSGYTDHNTDQIPAYMKSKKDFVERTVRELRPGRVLAVGCNTGYFSFISARSGAAVVAIDRDPTAVGKVWLGAEKESLNVLPLVVDFARPSPAMGWRHLEEPSFLERAAGKFDLVTMLAVLHHLLVSDRIPLREILLLTASLTTDAVLIEFVPPDDPMFQLIARGRDHLHAELTAQVFENAAVEFFDIVKTQPLSQTDRTLYLLRKR